MLSGAALATIGAYQRWLSPRKGYACAYRVAHGGTGCSGYAKQVIAAEGLIPSIPLIRQRFRDCHAAAVALATPADEEARLDRERRRRNERDADAARGRDTAGDCDAACSQLPCSGQAAWQGGCLPVRLLNKFTCAAADGCCGPN